MTQVIDRRKNTKGKSSENRQKFLKRVKGAIKEQLPNIISQRKIKDYGTAGGKVRISKHKGISEPSFRNGEGGKRDYVIPGNKEFIPGDTIPRDSGGGARGRTGSNEGSWEDDFVIELSQKEFLDYLFEDLELPNMLERQLKSLEITKFKNAGFSKEGAPNKLSIIRSFKQSLSRRIAIGSILNKKLKEKQKLFDEYVLETQHLIDEANDNDNESEINNIINERKNNLKQLEWFKEFIKLEDRSKNLPFFDPIDLRYKQMVKYQVPSNHATMIMIMDNSGSMGIHEKTIARKFFYLLYAFLKREYEKIDLIFISHTIEAKVMEEEEFFNTQESGGTVVSSALELAASFVQKIGTKSNIYISQISDGDNYSDDDKICEEIILNDIVSYVQYFAYIQIDDYHLSEENSNQITISQLLGSNKGLWQVYEKISEDFNNFKIKRVYEEKDIYPVFQQLFEKQS